MTRASVLLRGAKNTFVSSPVQATTRMISVVESAHGGNRRTHRDGRHLTWRDGRDTVWRGDLCIVLTRGRRLGSGQGDQRGASKRKKIAARARCRRKSRPPRRRKSPRRVFKIPGLGQSMIPPRVFGNRRVVPYGSWHRPKRRQASKWVRLRLEHRKRPKTWLYAIEFDAVIAS
jgi:hypothetical protein